MHEIKNAVCSNIVQANVGTVQFKVTDKEKKIDRVATIQFQNPKEAAKYVIGDSYDIIIKPVKK